MAKILVFIQNQIGNGSLLRSGQVSHSSHSSFFETRPNIFVHAQLTTKAITSWSASHFLLANCEYFDSLKGGDFLQISCWNATLPPLLQTRDLGLEQISIKAALELWAHIRNNKVKPFFLLFYNYITKMAGNLRPFMLLISHCLQ